MLTTDPTGAAGWREARARLVTAGSTPAAAADLSASADVTRATVLRTISRAGLGHVGGDLSVTDVLTTLYAAVLRIDPERPDWEDRDRFVLSKGHCAVSLYTTLARTGFFPEAALADFAGPLSPLNGHPNRTKVPGVETNTGPLGHGLPVAVGTAVAAQLRAPHRRTFVVLGDGELQEGSNWEAAMYAGHRGLSNLVAVVDRNRLQQGARTEDTNALDPLADKWTAFGWNAVELDGHDHLALLRAFGGPVDPAATPEPVAPGRPTVVIANTVKGKGVSFMEDGVQWHHKVPSAEQVAAALVELGAAR